jgi:hypothetical protein
MLKKTPRLLGGQQLVPLSRLFIMKKANCNHLQEQLFRRLADAQA